MNTYIFNLHCLNFHWIYSLVGEPKINEPWQQMHNCIHKKWFGGEVHGIRRTYKKESLTCSGRWGWNDHSETHCAGSCRLRYFKKIITALLRQFTCHKIYPLKCTTQWLLVYSQGWATITAINYRTLSSPPKEILFPLKVTPHSPKPMSSLTLSKH